MAPARNPVGLGIQVVAADPVPTLPFAPSRQALFKLEQSHLEGSSAKESTAREPMGVGKFPRRPYFNAGAYQPTDAPAMSTAFLPGPFRAIQKSKSKEQVSYSLMSADVLDWERRLRHMTAISSMMDWVVGTCLTILPATRGLHSRARSGDSASSSQLARVPLSASRTSRKLRTAPPVRTRSPGPKEGGVVAAVTGVTVGGVVHALNLYMSFQIQTFRLWRPVFL